MSTSLVLANGNLLVNIDYDLQLKDLYYPHIGLENQLNRYKNKFFISINKTVLDINSFNFELNIAYQEGYSIGKSTVRSKDYDVELELRDMVLNDRDIYIREILYKNHSNVIVDIGVFFQQNFSLYESNFADTTFWHPILNCMIHYKKNRYIASGFISGVTEFSCASKEDNDKNGAVPLFPDLNLDSNPIANGNVCSLISQKTKLAPKNDKIKNSNIYYFLITAKSIKEVEVQIKFLRTRFNQKHIKDLKIVLNKIINNDLQIKLGKYFDKSEISKIKGLYFSSIELIKTQIDKNGAIIASNDGQYLKKYGTDSYSYVWPRDAGETIKTLIDINEKELAKRSIVFLSKLIDPKGYMLHKYYPQVSSFSNIPGSSWQPWLSKNNNLILPIQEDSTALFVQAFAKYIVKYNDQELLYLYWNKEIKKSLNFLIDYRFSSLNKNNYFKQFTNDFKEIAPRNVVFPSFDIWEQYYGVFTCTTAQVITAMDDGIKLCKIMEDSEMQNKLQLIRDELYESLITSLFDSKSNIFLKGIYLKETELISSNEADSSLIYLWKNNIFNIIDPKITSTMEFLIKELEVRSEIKGFSRKLNDHYLKLSEQNNPWVISTLWFSQYYFLINDIDNAKKNLMWVIDHADRTGLLSEQINPMTGFSLGVKPLTWSHAEFINTVNLFIKDRDL